MSARRTSRRRFLASVAATTAAAMAGPAVALAADDAKRVRRAAASKPAASPPLTEAVRKGIAEQRGYLKQTLDVIRAQELPPGSEQAFVFTPLPPAPKRGAR